jgi:hypothetical protein
MALIIFWSLHVLMPLWRKQIILFKVKIALKNNFTGKVPFGMISNIYCP